MSDWEHLDEETDSELPRNEVLMEDVLWGGGTGAGWQDDVEESVDSLRFWKVDIGRG